MTKPQSNFFYVATRGYTASTWLSNKLSLHPDVVSFHSGGIATYYPKPGKAVTPYDYAVNLINMREMTGNAKIFGGVHVYYYADDMFRACEELGGQFAYIIRHPIRRAYSIQWSSIQSELSNPGHGFEFADEDGFLKYLHAVESDLEKYVDSIGFADMKRQLYKHEYQFPKRFSREWFRRNFIPGNRKSGNEWKKNVPQQYHFILNSFFTAVINTIFFDELAVRVAGPERAIMFEKMVADAEYFKEHVFKKILPNTEITEAYMNQVFDNKLINTHTKLMQGVGWETVYEKWPRCFQRAFDRIAREIIGGDPINVYKHFDYELPK